jgi:hypothetical protein
MVWRRCGSVELLIAAPPEAIYAVVSDIASVGERSDECHAAQWLLGQDRAVAGARFRGRNKHKAVRWSRVCEVVEAEPGKRFAFRTVPERFDLSRADSTTWRYELTAEPAGTLVRHSYEITKLPLPPFRLLYGWLMPHHKDMRPAMRITLDRLAHLAPTR